ncbi:hypothetical protein KCU64_g30, partial [Aureobasidium melanogenum]
MRDHSLMTKKLATGPTNAELGKHYKAGMVMLTILVFPFFCRRRFSDRICARSPSLYVVMRTHVQPRLLPEVVEPPAELTQGACASLSWFRLTNCRSLCSMDLLHIDYLSARNRRMLYTERATVAADPLGFWLLVLVVFKAGELALPDSRIHQVKGSEVWARELEIVSKSKVESLHVCIFRR